MPLLWTPALREKTYCPLSFTGEDLRLQESEFFSRRDKDGTHVPLILLYTADSASSRLSPFPGESLQIHPEASGNIKVPMTHSNEEEPGSREEG